MQRYTRQQSVIAYWGMGLYWGRALSQNKKGHLLGHVKASVSPAVIGQVQQLAEAVHALLLGPTQSAIDIGQDLQCRPIGAAFEGGHWTACVTLREGFLTISSVAAH